MNETVLHGAINFLKNISALTLVFEIELQDNVTWCSCALTFLIFRMINFTKKIEVKIFFKVGNFS